MVPRAVLMKSGLVSINTARQVNAAHTKSTVNATRPMSYLSKKAHSTVKRPIHNNTTFKNSNFNQRVNTVKDKNVKDKNVNTVRPKVVVNDVMRNNVNAVNASACWVWKPKTKVLDHGNPQMDLQDQGVIDSGCLRHMTGNMSYLTDYEEIDGGYVAFGGNPKGGKITRKVNPTIYTSCIEQFWATVKAKTINGEVLLQALVDGKKIIITESTMRRDLQLEDAEGVDCQPNATIFEQLALMGNLDNVGKFLMYPRFVQVFLDKQLEGMSNHKRIYVTPSHTKKIFRNIKRVGKGFSGRVTPLFPTMVAHNQEEMGEGSVMPTDPHHTPTIIQPSTSQPQKTQKPRRSKRKDTEVPQPSGPTTNVVDEAVNEEMDDSLVRAADN
ncbi:hypothetical protein Tco_0761667 [Tanacetum coccineum]